MAYMAGRYSAYLDEFEALRRLAPEADRAALGPLRHREIMAQFPWRWTSGTISTSLDLISGMSVHSKLCVEPAEKSMRSEIVSRRVKRLRVFARVGRSLGNSSQALQIAA